MGVKRVDAFGNTQLGSARAFRSRLIQTGATTFAIFPEQGDPGSLEFKDVPVIKGRTLTATLVDDQPFVFQRASCGCQTPDHLRGPQSRFLALLNPANA